MATLASQFSRAQVLLGLLGINVPCGVGEELEKRLASWLSGPSAESQEEQTEVLARLAVRLPKGWSPPGASSSTLGWDVLLAAACLEGLPGAIAELEALLDAASIRGMLARFEGQGLSIGDLLQELKQKLLVPSQQSPPRLSRYRGDGALEYWLRAAAVRLALDALKRSSPNAESIELASDVAVLQADAEWLYLERRHGQDVRSALRAAVGELPARDINVLRLHFLDGLNIDAIGQSYGVHRATVARWIVRARRTLLERTRILLGERLRLSPDEVHSLIRSLRSGFQASIASWLTRGEPS